MVFPKVMVAAAFALSTLAVAPAATAQANNECRRSCDRTYQACNRGTPDSPRCMGAWHSCKRTCRSGATIATRTAPRPVASPSARTRGNEPVRVTGPR